MVGGEGFWPRAARCLAIILVNGCAGLNGGGCPRAAALIENFLPTLPPLGPTNFVVLAHVSGMRAQGRLPGLTVRLVDFSERYAVFT